MDSTTKPPIVEDSPSSSNPLSGMFLVFVLSVAALFLVNWGSQSVGATLEDYPVQHLTHLLLGH